MNQANKHSQSKIEAKETILEITEKLGIPQIERHLLLCSDQTKPKCCTKEASLASWNYLKSRLKELKLDRPTADRPNCIFRTKANCLRVCSEGPILLVYPDGTWYKNVTPEAIEKIIQEHLIGNRVVAEYVFYQRPLPETGKVAELENLESDSEQ